MNIASEVEIKKNEKKILETLKPEIAKKTQSDILK